MVWAVWLASSAVLLSCDTADGNASLVPFTQVSEKPLAVEVATEPQLVGGPISSA